MHARKAHKCGWKPEIMPLKRRPFAAAGVPRDYSARHVTSSPDPAVTPALRLRLPPRRPWSLLAAAALL